MSEIIEKVLAANQERENKLGLITQLHSQARDLLLEKGKDIPYPKLWFSKPPEVLNKRIDTITPEGLEITIGSSNAGKSTQIYYRTLSFSWPWEISKLNKELHTFYQDTPIYVEVGTPPLYKIKTKKTF